MKAFFGRFGLAHLPAAGAPCDRAQGSNVRFVLSTVKDAGSRPFVMFDLSNNAN